MYRKHALFYVVIGFTILCCFSCRQIDSGKVEITNSLSSIVRITFAQNYGREIISMNQGKLSNVIMSTIMKCFSRMNFHELHIAFLVPGIRLFH